MFYTTEEYNSFFKLIDNDFYLKFTKKQFPEGSKKYKNRKPPGQHGANLKKKKLTEYGVQVRETKKLRLFYGVSKKYLNTQYRKATGMKGNKIYNMVGILERRLSSFVYRCKFATSIEGAKQLVSHGHILVNGKKVDISSYMLKVGDVVSLKEGEMRENHHVLNSVSALERTIPAHLEVDRFSGKLIRIPTVYEGLYFCPINIPAVIEFLAK
jgi:small subunit ribosomal protein S4